MARETEPHRASLTFLAERGLATAAVAAAVARYTARYREPRVNPNRVAIVIAVTRLLGDSALLA